MQHEGPPGRTGQDVGYDQQDYQSTHNLVCMMRMTEELPGFPIQMGIGVISGLWSAVIVSIVLNERQRRSHLCDADAIRLDALMVKFLLFLDGLVALRSLRRAKYAEDKALLRDGLQKPQETRQASMSVFKNH
jgi:hypothetical protein